MSPLLLVSVVLSAQSCPKGATDAASAAYRNLDHAAAVSALEGLERCTDGTAAELADALRWRAQALFALERESEAIEAFALLATVLPTYDLDPMLSPRLHELFRTARVRVMQGRFVFARLKAPREQGLEVEVFGAESAYDEVQVQTTPGGAVVAMREDGTWRAKRPPEARSARVMLRSKGKTVLLGPEVPLPVLTPGEREPAVDVSTRSAPAKVPWVWVGVGGGAVLVVAVAIGVGFGLSSRGAGRAGGSLGSVELP